MGEAAGISRHCAFDVPLGRAIAIRRGAALAALSLHPDRDSARDALERLGTRSVRDDADPLLSATRAQLDEYFDGRRRAFDLPLAPRGTPFQQRVWQALLGIPYGTTTTYGAIAESLGRPAAVRAVGAANGKNPLAVIVPCHRVVGADGSLTGYAGGLAIKRALLVHEGAIPPGLPLFERPGARGAGRDPGAGADPDLS